MIYLHTPIQLCLLSDKSDPQKIIGLRVVVAKTNTNVVSQFRLTVTANPMLFLSAEELKLRLRQTVGYYDIHLRDLVGELEQLGIPLDYLSMRYSVYRDVPLSSAVCLGVLNKADLGYILSLLLHFEPLRIKWDRLKEVRDKSVPEVGYIRDTSEINRLIINGEIVCWFPAKWKLGENGTTCTKLANGVYVFDNLRDAMILELGKIRHKPVKLGVKLLVDMNYKSVRATRSEITKSSYRAYSTPYSQGVWVVPERPATAVNICGHKEG